MARTTSRGRPRTSLVKGARNVAWHDALARLTGKSDTELDARYAQHQAGGKLRADGGGRDVFGRISRLAYDPAAVRRPGNMSVLEAVARDPEFAHVNQVYASELWRLLAPPPPSEAKLRDLIDTVLARHGLYRVSGKDPTGDAMAGNTFLKDKQPFRYASKSDYQESIQAISAWMNFDALFLLGALARERLVRGWFQHIESLQSEFEICLMLVINRYGLREKLGKLVGWLAHYRVFANQWDEIPDEQTREYALRAINSARLEKGHRPIRQIDFWTEALAIRYHNTGHCYRFPIVARTPEIEWLEANRQLLIEQMATIDSHGEVEGIVCPVGTADGAEELKSGMSDSDAPTNS